MSFEGAVEVRIEVRPRWPFRLSRRVGLDGLARIRGGVLHRLLHVGQQPVWIRIAQLSADRVLFGARAQQRELAEWGIERMRLALGIDESEIAWRTQPGIKAIVRLPVVAGAAQAVAAK